MSISKNPRVVDTCTELLKTREEFQAMFKSCRILHVLHIKNEELVDAHLVCSLRLSWEVLPRPTCVQHDIFMSGDGDDIVEKCQWR